MDHNRFYCEHEKIATEASPMLEWLLFEKKSVPSDSENDDDANDEDDNDDDDDDIEMKWRRELKLEFSSKQLLEQKIKMRNVLKPNTSLIPAAPDIYQS